METMKKIKFGKLLCDCISVQGSRTAYLITPMALDKAELSELASRFNVNIAVIHGVDWDDDMTPWPAPGVLTADADFKGEAAGFLSLLRSEVIPRIESLPGIDAGEGRILIGVSLSGLFALCAWRQCEEFSDIGSISGSFWYDGFAEWFCREGVRPKQGMAYFSLGQKEGGDKDHPRFRTVRQDTQKVIDSLSLSGTRTLFKSTAGNHYSPFLPRLEMALEALTKFPNRD